MARQDLRDALRGALVRQDLTDPVLDSWINSTTTRINTVLRHRRMIKHKVMDVTSRTFSTPSDFIEARNVRINSGDDSGSIDPGANRGELLYAPPSEIAEMAAASWVLNCGPRYFTMHGFDMELAPWRASASYQIEMWYYAELSLPPDILGTNFFLDKYPHIYLNGAITFAHRFELEEERALGYEALFLAEIQAINDAEKNAEVGNGPLIVRPNRRIGGRYS